MLEAELLGTLGPPGPAWQVSSVIKAGRVSWVDSAIISFMPAKYTASGTQPRSRQTAPLVTGGTMP